MECYICGDTANDTCGHCGKPICPEHTEHDGCEELCSNCYDDEGY